MDMKEPQEQEKKPAHSGDFLPEILDNLLEGCQIISPDWRYLYVNAAAARQAQCSTNRLLGRTMMDAFPGIENTRLFATLKQCMADRIPRRMENQFSFPDLTRGWFELRFEPVPEGLAIFSLDITKRKHVTEEQRIMYEVLQLINEAEDWQPLLKAVLIRLQEWSGCEAVGFRIKAGQDFPYFVTSGFPEDFVQAENFLCSYSENGEIELDSDGKPKMECMCGNILSGKYDPTRSFFTTDGCFWSNCTTELLAHTTEADRLARTRNRCNGEGFESVALIPLRSGKETLGLIQLNDSQKNRFTPESIALYRRIADRIANFTAKKQAEAKVSHLNAILRGIRNVNQLIVHEKDPEQLIRKACELLVESRGFESVALGLTDVAGGRVLSHVVAGKPQPSMQELLQKGQVPACVCQALTKRRIFVRKGQEPPGRELSDAPELGPDQDQVAVVLEHEGTIFGFMVAYLPRGMAEDREEQGLLKEIAGDIAFALHHITVHAERDASADALVKKEEQFRQSQKLESVGRLAGGVAHDFNNILAAQIGYCELIKRKLKAEDPLVEDIDKILTCAERAATLTRQLLAFSRKQTLKTEVKDLNAVVAGIEMLLERVIGEDIEFSTNLFPELWRVKVDPAQIEQVIMNLAVNARDAMPNGGKLTIETANVDLDNEYVSKHLGTISGPHVLLAINDTGVGMDEKTKKRMFEPFYTTKAQGKGTGLGLATVYGIIKQSGGNIWVYSELGKGTSFKIYLPRIEADLTPTARRETRLAYGNGELVLLVEDDQFLRELFARMFEDLGYRVDTAANGDEALTLVKAGGLRPALLFTDVVLPGMSGKVLAERLGQLLPELKVLYTSGYTDNAIVHHGVLDPEISFLQKPFNIVQLATMVREVLFSD